MKKQEESIGATKKNEISPGTIDQERNRRAFALLRVTPARPDHTEKIKLFSVTFSSSNNFIFSV